MAQFNKTAAETLPLIYLVPQSSTTAPAGINSGGSVATVGTISHPTPTYGNATALGVRRTKFVSSASATNGASLLQPAAIWYGVSGNDGFDVNFEFDIASDATVLGASGFFGVMVSPAALAGNASALASCVGIGYDAGDALTANLNYYAGNASVTTKTAIPGSGRAGLLGHKLNLRIRSIDSGNIQITLRDLNASLGNTTGVTLLQVDVGPTGTVTTVPAVETALGFVAAVYNGAVAQAVNFEFQKLVISAAN